MSFRECRCVMGLCEKEREDERRERHTVLDPLSVSLKGQQQIHPFTQYFHSPHPTRSHHPYQRDPPVDTELLSVQGTLYNINRHQLLAPSPADRSVSFSFFVQQEKRDQPSGLAYMEIQNLLALQFSLPLRSSLQALVRLFVSGENSTEAISEQEKAPGANDLQMLKRLTIKQTKSPFNMRQNLFFLTKFSAINL